MKSLCVLFGLCLAILSGCNGIYGYSVIMPNAQITKVYNITDTSAQVNIQVTKQSNAVEDDSLGVLSLQVFVGDVTLGTNSLDDYFQTYNAATDPLPSSVTLTILGLNTKISYTLQLFYLGTFSGNGVTAAESSFIGTSQTFTTN